MYENYNIVEPPNNGHIGSGTFVHCSEVVLISEGAIELYFHCILLLYRTFSITCYIIDTISRLNVIIGSLACYIIK